MVSEIIKKILCVNLAEEMVFGTNIVCVCVCVWPALVYMYKATESVVGPLVDVCLHVIM